MKIIDLLNKIANGEEVPKVIKIGKNKYTWKKELNVYASGGGSLCFDYFVENNKLNDEVEIIEEDKKDNYTGWKMYQDGREVCSIDCLQEEDKKIEKTNHLIGYDIRQFKDLREYVGITTNDLFGKTNKIIDKINEIIDKINKGE